ncbi:hypothetical protein ACCO45_006855 [Purpureocillium lilacinum]|uniref:Uncharacterized protein n=1 Tax=Purpureocillium lilacinum TaxID=33203 RepID=A0ACC4DRH0_PURLI
MLRLSHHRRMRCRGCRRAAAPRDGSLSIDNSHQGNNNNNNPADDGNASKKKRGFVEEVRRTFWMVVTYSWLNVLLVFVPIGIVVANVPGVHGGIVFAMNCIAVIPLAGLSQFRDRVGRK